MIQLEEPRKSHPFSLFNLGFRPFFLLGALVAAAFMGHWLGTYQKSWLDNYYQLGSYWHGHEMLLGFTIAIIGGFLLTAVRTWTQQQTPFGWKLAVIVVVWLAGRLAPFTPLPPLAIALIDLSFIPLVAVGVGIPIIRSRNYRNLGLLAALSGFFIANVLVHLQLLGFSENTLDTGLKLALYLAIIIITIIGGRVIPFFTERGIGNITSTRYSLIEKSIIPLSVFWLICQLLGYTQLVIASNIIMGTVHLIRLSGWWNKALPSKPLVWILHAGYGCLMLGCWMSALAAAELISTSLALHMFTVGAIGGLTLGMMARVSLGHTGRSLDISPLITIAFVCMMLSTALRASVGLLAIDINIQLMIAGSLWGLAWLLFLYKYSLILIKPRADGLWG